MTPDIIQCNLAILIEASRPLPIIEAAILSTPESDRVQFVNGTGGCKLQTPLMLAAKKGDEDLVQLLLKHGAKVNLTENGKERSALHKAATSGHVNVISLLLNAGADIEAKDAQRLTPLMTAAKKGMIKAVEAFLDAGAKNDNALEQAAIKGHKDVVEFLIARGADNSKMLLRLAAQNGHAEVLKSLIKKGVDVNELPNHCTPLHLAARNGHTAAASVLLENRANIEAKSHSGMRALYYAVDSGQYDLVELLIKAKAEVNAKNGRYEFTALHLAVDRGRKEIVKLLLINGADVEAEDARGQRPLLFAARNGDIPIMEILLDAEAEFGADFHVLRYLLDPNKPKVGEWAIDYIRSELVKLHQEIEKERAFEDVDNYEYLLSKTVVFIKCVKVSDDYFSLFESKASAAISAMTSLILSQSALILIQFEKKIKELEVRFEIEKKKGTIEALGAFQSELQVFSGTKLRLSRVIKAYLDQVFKPEFSSMMYAGYRPLVKRIDGLKLDCEQILTSLKRKQMSWKEAEAVFDAEDVFSLLVQFGGGVGDLKLQIKPAESYPILFGCNQEDFWKCGIYSGTDLRALGVERRIHHLIETQAPSQEILEQMQEVVAVKTALFEILKKIGYQDPQFDEIVKKLQMPVGIVNLQFWVDLELLIGRVLLRMFFSQGIETIKGKIGVLGDEATLRELVKASHLTLIDLFAFKFVTSP